MTQTVRIAFANISGGEGKTTLTREVGFALAALGCRVALIDADPQASLSKWLGLHNDPDPIGLSPERSILGAYSSDPKLPKPFQVGLLDVWPANVGTEKADLLAITTPRDCLRQAVDQIENKYDCILIDTKPGKSDFLLSTLIAADYIVVPVSDIKGMENLDKLSELIRKSRSHSKDLDYLMFVPNKHSAYTRVGKAIIEDLRSYSNTARCSSPIRHSVVFKEAARAQQPLIKYKSKSAACEDIQKVTSEIIEAIHVKEKGELYD